MPHIEQLKIRTSDCDKYLKITPSSVLDLFQETAGRHSITFGLDSPTLIQDRGMTWVLTAMALNFDHYPKWPESVGIQTWIKELKGFKALRDYSVYDESGRNVINGSSVWALLDLQTRRPVKIGSLNTELEIEQDNHSIVDIIPGRMKSPDDYGNNEITIKVNSGDIDLNNHVSNIQYLAWMYTSQGEEFLKDYELSSVNISYRGETHLNDELLYKNMITEDNGSHCFINKLTGKVVCIISSSWRKKY